MKKSFLILVGIVSLAIIQPSFAQEPTGFVNSNISNNSGDSVNPQAVFSGNSIYVVWTDTTSGVPGIFFAKSTDGGQSFSKPVNIGTANSGDSAYATITSQDNNIYVTWQGSFTSNPVVYFTKSKDSGNTFEKPIIISDKSKNSAFPQVASNTNHVYVTWIEKSENDTTNVIFSKSDDMGDSFGKTISITSSKETVGIPKIASDGNAVYLLWEDNSKGSYEILLAKSTDSGSTFASPVNVSNTSGSSGAPQMAIANNKIYVVWMDDTNKNYEIYFSKSDDGGTSFAQPVNVSNTSGDSGYAQLATYGSNVYIVWTETISDTNYDILFTKSGNDGKTFEKPINISSDTGASGWPQIIVENGGIYISWVDSSPGKFDVYVTKSPDGGTTFVKPVDISNTKGESYLNKMGITPNAAYMVWQEENNKSHDIIFAKSVAFVPEFGAIASAVLAISILAIVLVSKTRLRL